MDQSGKLRLNDYLFPSRLPTSPDLGTRQYARIADRWVEEAGLDATGLWHAFDSADQADADL